MIGALRRLYADPVVFYLLAGGTGFVVLGMQWILDPTPSRVRMVDWIAALTPGVVGIIWLIVGVLAATGALGLPTRPALVVMQAWPLILAAFSVVSWALSLLPWTAELGSRTGLASAVSYALISLGAHAVGRLWAERTVKCPATREEGADASR